MPIKDLEEHHFGTNICGLPLTANPQKLDSSKSVCTSGLEIYDSEIAPLLGEVRTSTIPSYGGSDCRGQESHDDHERINCFKKPSPFWLLPPFFIFSLSSGVTIVPHVNLFVSLVCRSHFFQKSAGNPNIAFPGTYDNHMCQTPEIQSIAIKFSLLMSMTAGMFGALMSPKLGAWSDRHGRRKPLIINCLGAAIAEVLIIIIATYPMYFDYRWLVISAFIEGITGSFNTGFAITRAYATDCTAPTKRAVALGYFHASLFSGIALGPLLAAFLVRQTQIIISASYAAAGIRAAYILFLLFAVPESLVEERQMEAREQHLLRAKLAELKNEESCWWKDVLKKIDFLNSLRVLYPKGPGSSDALRTNLILLSAIDTILYGVTLCVITLTIYYLGYRFQWNTFDLSIFTFLINVCRVSALILILPTLNYFIHTRYSNHQRKLIGQSSQSDSGCTTSDLWIIRCSILIEAIGFAVYAITKNGSLFVAAGVIGSLGGMAAPTVQSVLTRHVHSDQVGKLLGSSGLLHGVAKILFPLLLNLAYAETVGKLPQAVFFVLICCNGTALLLSLKIKTNVHVPILSGATIECSMLLPRSIIPEANTPRRSRSSTLL
ncbi:tetracycline-efflux transporter [Blumeria hordei DH14]|uniref:Tetracycline-efflux transporter n=1 Tax=Blumeria graminis f. sp. hordei (strain DH14) TaxID=546991 RepID=N1JD96_BLUG1|nr:tetracycline-efflux transporter [Blumeria hordei DH14]